MSYAQNIFTTTSPNETNFVITWTAPYYMTTADVKAEVDKVAWTVVSVSGTNVTLATGIPTDSTVRIYRETDVSSNEVDFLAGSPFRAGDVNLNFDQTLFAIQEALTSDENHEADIDRLEGLIDTILALLNNNIQFVQVANVAALDTVAATDPENLKGYEVTDSTGLEGANPEIPLLPPKAGTGTGEDPVTGVYWNAGISTKVLWDKANQNWIYVSYFASNGDNRYQQITLQQATAPVLADFKNGTLWFNTTDQNLYVLYDDAGTRSWVLVGPLRDDRYVNRTGDSMTGNLLMNNANVVFEGSTDDGFETTLTVTDPTADNSIVLPDVSGNVVTTGDTGTVTSTMIADGTIVDADVNASAAIDLTKLGSGALPSNITVNSDNITNLSIVNDDVNANAEIEVSKLANGTARQLLQTDAAGTGVEFTSNVDVPGTLDVTGTAVFDSSVGIGTTSPSYLLDLSNSSNAYLRQTRGSNAFRVGPAGDQAGDGVILGTDTNGPLRFFTNSSSNERLRIDSSGNVGIATTSPSRLLTVAGISRFENFIEFGGSISTPGTAAAIYRPADNNLAFSTASTERLRIDSSGNVGIGTSSPTRPLTVASSTGATNILGVFDNSGTTATNCIIAFSDPTSTQGQFSTRLGSVGNSLAFYTNGSNERLRIDSSGKVGIGVVPPNYGSGRNSLDIHSSGSAITHFGITNSTTGSGGASNGFNIIQNGLDTQLFLRESGFMSFSTAATERMRIDSSGRLLVGISSYAQSTTAAFKGGYGNAGNPGRIALLRGYSTISGNNINAEISRIIFADDNGNGDGAQIRAVIDGTSWSTTSKPTRLEFYTCASSSVTPAQRLQIDSSGSLLVGRTSTYFGTGQVAAFQGAKHGVVIFQTANVNYTCLNLRNSYANNSGNNVSGNMITFHDNGGTERGKIATTGSSTSYITSSDYRLKENVSPLTGAIDRISKFKVHRFNFIGVSDSKVDGFLAHEAQTVVPEAVTGTKDEVDGDGKAVMQGIDQAKLVPLLTAALQEAITKIETLETKVAALEAG